MFHCIYLFSFHTSQVQSIAINIEDTNPLVQCITSCVCVWVGGGGWVCGCVCVCVGGWGWVGVWVCVCVCGCVSLCVGVHVCVCVC